MLILAALLIAVPVWGLEHDRVSLEVTPSATGQQLIRTSLPIPRGFLREGQTLVADDGQRKLQTAVRPLSWYAAEPGSPQMPRRAIITFPYVFKSLAPVQFRLGRAVVKQTKIQFGVQVTLKGEVFNVSYTDGPEIKLRIIAPIRTSTENASREIVESNAFYRWERFRFPDPQWPRVIEVRSDALGGVVAIAHLQRNLRDNGRAPDFGWEAETFDDGHAALAYDTNLASAKSQEPKLASDYVLGSKSITHAYTNGAASTLFLPGRSTAFITPPRL